MVYLDTSVAIAHLAFEDRRPSREFWSQSLISSRLLEYEIFNKAHQPGTPRELLADGVALLQRIALVEIIPEIVDRLREPLPGVKRTLDALHLASVLFLASEGVAIQLASYDRRMQAGAQKLGIPLAPL